MNNLLDVLIYGLLAGLVMLAGVYVVRYFDKYVKKISVFLLSFAVGVLLANGFFHLLPEAVKLTSGWTYWVLGAIILLYIIEHATVIHSCREEGCEAHSHLGATSFIGISFHSLLDGVIIGIAFQPSFALGLTTSLAIIFHKFAEGGCTYALFVCDEKSQSKAMRFSWLVALATPLGALAAYFLTIKIPDIVLGGLLAAAGGSLIYIGASDLMPATHKKYGWFNVVLVLAGVAFVLLISRFV